MLRQASQQSWTGELAVEAVDLVKDFAEKRAVDGVSLEVPAGSIFGLLGPNGAGKTTTLRMLLGIIEPSSGERRILGFSRPIEAAHQIGYLPEERGLYPSMTAREGIAFMGALRGMRLKAARQRASELLEESGLGEWAKKPIRTLSKGMAQTVQLLGTLVHEPRLIRNRAADGVTIIFSTHVIAHAERLCESIAIIAAGKVAFKGRVDEARARLRPVVRLRTRQTHGPWRSAIPETARNDGGEWIFELPEGGPEPLLKALIDGGAGIETLAIERPGLHEAFVAIAGDAAAQAMEEEPGQ